MTHLKWPQLLIFVLLPNLVVGWSSVCGADRRVRRYIAFDSHRSTTRLHLRKLVQDTTREGVTKTATINKPATSRNYGAVPVVATPDDVGASTSEDKKTKIVVLALLWLLATLSALDRVAMSVALVPMTDEFGFTDSVKGSISSLFSVGYGLCILPAGLAIATLSPRLVMAFGLVVWSLSTIATPVAAEISNSMLPLLVARACVGAAESVLLPTMQRFLAAWTKPDEKSTSFAIIISGFQTGTIAAYLVSPVIMDYFGSWREIFYIYGTIGILFLVPWLSYAQDNPKGQLLDERKIVVAENEESNSKWDNAVQVFRDAPWKGFATSPGCWGMLLAHCSKNWGLYNTLAWTPTFYFEQYGLSVRDSALLSVLPSVSGAVGGLIAGNLADAVIRNMEDRSVERLTTVRKVFQSIALLGPALTLGTLASDIPHDPEVAQFFLMATVGLQSFGAAGFEAGNQEKAGEKWAGLLYSVTTLPVSSKRSSRRKCSLS
mmetsp:Transcript_30805/g.64316  ORF Transcript_30805/g.64316 Transcript_30805/m.64316 type:complete len:490 (+) Transcript_30805:164-1633(+)